MRTSEYQHLIFVRPPGSLTWTLHMTPEGTPWRDGRAKRANSEACAIVEHTNCSAIVVPVKLPRDAEPLHYALFADGDTLYAPTKPVLMSKRTGRAYGINCAVCGEPICEPQATEHTDDGLAHAECTVAENRP